MQVVPARTGQERGTMATSLQSDSATLRTHEAPQLEQINDRGVRTFSPWARRSWGAAFSPPLRRGAHVPTRLRSVSDGASVIPEGGASQARLGSTPSAEGGESATEGAFAECVRTLTCLLSPISRGRGATLPVSALHTLRQLGARKEGAPLTQTSSGRSQAPWALR